MADFLGSILGWLVSAVLGFYFPEPRPDSLSEAFGREGTYLEIFGVGLDYVEAATVKLGVTALALIVLARLLWTLIKLWWKRRNAGGGGGLPPGGGKSPVSRRTDK